MIVAPATKSAGDGRMAALRARRRVGVAIVKVTLKPDDLHRLGLTAASRSGDIAAAIVDVIRQSRTSSRRAIRPTASSTAVPTLRGGQEARAATACQGGGWPLNFDARAAPKFDPNAPFGQMRDSGRSPLVQNGIVYDDRHQQIRWA